MKPLMLGLTASLFAATALAQAPLAQAPPKETTICIDVGGASLPAVCRVSGERLDPREDICLCPEGQRVQAPVCGPGETPQPENRAFEIARRKAAADGSLIGDLYEGKPMCMAPRKP